MNNFKRNNKGSTIVLVLVVLAVVGIIATVALWIALSNFNMKITDQKTTKSFYSAEEVLDQIRAGLQGDVSEALETAYSKSLSEYSMNTSTEARNNMFASTYVYSLRTKISYNDGTGADDTKCSLAKLRSYVAEDVWTSGTVNIYSNYGGNTDYCLMSASSDGVAIKDLVVEYTDSDGYLSIIQTDIVMQIPDMNLVSSDGVPNVFSYSIIGNRGVSVGSDAKAAPGTVINGNVYAGSMQAAGDAQGSTKDAEFYKSLVVASGSDCNFAKSTYVIADGDTVVNGNGGAGMDFTVNEMGQLWSRNLDVTHANAGLYGISYIADDMTLAGDSPSVTFSRNNGVLGSYYGYSDSTTNPSESSAIILNGRNSQLDLSGISQLVVSGYSFIGTSKIANSTDPSIKNDNSILMGESIAIKGDQIAYLVPTECVGTLKEGTASLVNENPMSYGTYKNIVDNSDKYKLVNEKTIINRTGKTLEDYIGAENIATNGINHYIQTIFVPGKSSNKDSDGVVYLYLKLDKDTANTYFMDYYKGDSGKLDKYVDFYSSGVQAVGEDAQIFTAGSFLEYDDTTKDATFYSMNKDSINGGVLTYPNTYEALTTRLITDLNKVSTEQRGKTVFENIIQTGQTEPAAGDGMNMFLSVLPGKTFSATAAGTGGGTLYFVMHEGNYTFSDGNQSNQYILIVNGDVTVEKNFTGTIIASGKVTVAGTNITMNTMSTENIKRLLGVPCENGTVSLHAYDFFKDGNAYVASGYGTSDLIGIVQDEKGNEISLSDLIVYQNWKKR